MHGNRIWDLISIMFWSHALRHPYGDPRIIICEPSEFESRFFFGCMVPVNELVYFSFLTSSVLSLKFITSVS